MTQSDALAIEIRKDVEQILRKHVRNLAGQNHELNQIFLSLDLMSLTSSILLVDREIELRMNQMEQNKSTETKEDETDSDKDDGTIIDDDEDAIVRYTEETLLEALAEMKIGQEKEVKRTIQFMTQHKFFGQTEKGELGALENAFKLTSLFNTIFPKMPGLNLVVYFTQIMDEVVSNRKTVELAIAQIDKQLHVQGISKDKTKTKPRTDQSKTRTDQTKATSTRNPLAALISKSKRPTGLDRLMMASRAKSQTGKPEGSEQKIMGTAGTIIKSSTSEMEKPTPDSPAKTDQTSKNNEVDLSDIYSKSFVEDYEGSNNDLIKLNMSEDFDVDFDPQSAVDLFMDDQKSIEDPFDSNLENEDLDIKTSPLDDFDSISSGAQEYADMYLDKIQFHKPSTNKSEDMEFDQQQEKEKSTEEEEEEEEEELEIETQSDEFVEYLKCPVCHLETMEKMMAANNKEYYLCNNETCQFISWDKPVDVSCPRCSNLFLVEKIDENGSVSYHCPKNDCDYQQDDLVQREKEEAPPEPAKPKKKRRVVRKVFVRKK